MIGHHRSSLEIGQRVNLQLNIRINLHGNQFTNIPSPFKFLVVDNAHLSNILFKN